MRIRNTEFNKTLNGGGVNSYYLHTVVYLSRQITRLGERSKSAKFSASWQCVMGMDHGLSVLYYSTPYYSYILHVVLTKYGGTYKWPVQMSWQVWHVTVCLPYYGREKWGYRG